MLHAERRDNDLLGREPKFGNDLAAGVLGDGDDGLGGLEGQGAPAVR